MNRILSVDPDDLVAVVEPGVVLADLQAAVERKGLFYPPDPASSGFCTVGGRLRRARGAPLREVRRDPRLPPLGGGGAADREIVHTGSRTLKAWSGTTLAASWSAPRGQLCVFTRAVLRLIPLPACVRTVMAFFRRVDDAVDAAHGVMRSGILPRTLELMDEMTIRCIVAL